MEKGVYIKEFDTFDEAKDAFDVLRKRGLSQVSLLGRINPPVQEIHSKSSQDLTKVLSSEKEVGFFLIPEIGKLFIIGSLTFLLMEIVGLKISGVSNNDISNLLAGLGLTAEEVREKENDLKDGKHLIIVRENSKKISKIPEAVGIFFN